MNKMDLNSAEYKIGCIRSITKQIMYKVQEKEKKINKSNIKRRGKETNNKRTKK